MTAYWSLFGLWAASTAFCAVICSAGRVPPPEGRRAFWWQAVVGVFVFSLAYRAGG